MKTAENGILASLKYFSFFRYPPNFREIHTFLKIKASKRHLAGILKTMEKKGIVKGQIPNIKYQILRRSDWNHRKSESDGIVGPNKFQIENEARYTLGEYYTRPPASKFQISNIKFQIKMYDEKYRISQTKLNNIRFRLYVKLLSLFSQIKLIGLSGTLAMMNAKKHDDIDLFIIAAKNRLFTARAICVILAEIIGIRRKRITTSSTSYKSRYADKVCLNLFFDEKDMGIAKSKQTEYVAHEVLQMKPLINRDCTYEKFLYANRWVCKIFPNSSSKFKVQSSKFQFKIQIFNIVTNGIENMAKKIQLSFINRHKTTEIITDSQLWFFPEDFEEKIPMFADWKAGYETTKPR